MGPLWFFWRAHINYPTIGGDLFAGMGHRPVADVARTVMAEFGADGADGAGWPPWFPCDVRASLGRPPEV